MNRIALTIGAVLLLLGFVITPVAARTARTHAASPVFSVGLVTDVGGINDKSFNHLAYLGLEKARTKYHIKADYIQSTGAADYVPNLTHFARAHYDLTIGVGFLMTGAMYQVATQFPGQKFALIDGAPTNAKGATVNLRNVANLFFKEQESGYLVGIIAGLMEKNHVGVATHNTIGFMGGVSIPPVNRYIAGYVAGARHADPGIHILRGYSQSFTNEGAGKEIGLTQISGGADILFQVAGASGLGYLAAAQQRGKYGIGVDASQGYLGRFVITSALKKVDVAVLLMIKQTMQGRFRGGDHHFDLQNNSTGFAKPSPVVPSWVTAQARTYERLIKRGSIVPPTIIPQ
ncbi:MAG: BMP family ABC transporter substrate-binding protein [Chloroflexota bacterium]|nr:BMP family ABC transporter substrate-binding protein [Chloroflexota bacterium]